MKNVKKVTASPKKKILFVVGCVALVCITLTGIFYAYQFERWLAARHKLEGVRSQERHIFDQEMAQRTELLKSAGIIDASLASSEADVCYVNSKDTGWVTTGWYQECYLRSVRGFTTHLSKIEILQRLNGLSADFGEVQSNTTDDQVAFPCSLADLNGDDTLRFIAANGANSDRLGCAIPSQAKDSMLIVPDVSQGQLSIKYFNKFNASAIDSSSTQVWLMFNDVYYHENLGCGIGPCFSPRLKPAQAP